MKIQLHEIPIRDVFNGYIDKNENGVFGYGGLLDIRPPYQREFIYDEKQQQAVIESIMADCPINVMYWAVKCDVNGQPIMTNGQQQYEVMDGQQRVLSICRYIDKQFAVNFRYFHNLTDDEREKLLDYKLMIYFCEGTASERLKWFQTINIAGAKLTQQELRNAVYAGPWLTSAKQYFSKTNCPAKKLDEKFPSLPGKSIRQDWLERVLNWAAEADGKTIEEYMAEHQQDENASELWSYFESICDWGRSTFPIIRKKEMQPVEWGILYNNYHNQNLDSAVLEQRVAKLMEDEEVTNKKGIYEYVLDDDERHLSLRAFPDSMKRSAYEKQHGICPDCGKSFDIKQMEGDHILPWSKGGRTVPENCQMLCKHCNGKKSAN